MNTGWKTRAAASATTIGILLVGGCASQPAVSADTMRVSVMTFNLQNLFDTRHDPGKDDYTFLPAAAKDNAEHRARCGQIEVRKWREECLDLDWSDEVLAVKLTRLATAILDNENGLGPDILVVQEVENLRVLELLRTNYLTAGGYRPAVLIEGADDRGIDVGFISRLPLVGSPKLHPTRFENIEAAREKDTRGILEATFRLPDGNLLTGFAVHFPSPFHPTDLRVQSYRFLNSLKAALPAGRAAFAAGDFNTIAADGGIIDRYAGQDWLVAHRLGCAACRGTYYYAPNDDWSFLDMILVSPELAPDSGGWRLVPGATRVANAAPGQGDPQAGPQAFRQPAMTGVSDHWPLRIELLRTP